jgi:hypothetical protein
LPLKQIKSYHYGNYRKDISDTLLSFRLLLKLLTKTFLLDDDLPQFTANKSLQSAIESHRSSFTALKKSLSDAKLEFFNIEMRQNSHTYDDIVKSLQRLAQHVGGLRSSCGLQFEKMKSDQLLANPIPSNQSAESLMETGKSDPATPQRNRTLARTLSFFPQPKPKDTGTWNVRAGYSRRKIQEEMKRQKRSMSTVIYTNNSPDEPRPLTKAYTFTGGPRVLTSPADDVGLSQPPPSQEMSDHYIGTLVDFIHNVRQPMKALAYTCKRTIINLQSRFTGENVANLPSFKLMRENLEKAIALFESSQKEAIFRMYRQQHSYNTSSENHGNTEQHCFNPMEQGEDVFLVYFFVFCLVEFARELAYFVGLVEKLFNTRLPLKESISRWMSHCMGMFKGKTIWYA